MTGFRRRGRRPKDGDGGAGGECRAPSDGPRRRERKNQVTAVLGVAGTNLSMPKGRTDSGAWWAPPARRSTWDSRITVGSPVPADTEARPLAGYADGPDSNARNSGSTERLHAPSICRGKLFAKAGEAGSAGAGPGGRPGRFRPRTPGRRLAGAAASGTDAAAPRFSVAGAPAPAPRPWRTCRHCPAPR
jgi:hypothetical protein